MKSKFPIRHQAANCLAYIDVLLVQRNGLLGMPPEIQADVSTGSYVERGLRPESANVCNLRLMFVLAPSRCSAQYQYQHSMHPDSCFARDKEYCEVEIATLRDYVGTLLVGGWKNQVAKWATWVMNPLGPEELDHLIFQTDLCVLFQWHCPLQVEVLIEIRQGLIQVHKHV